MSPDVPVLLDRFIDALPAANGDEPPLAVFDCDGTIIHGDIGEAVFYRQIEGFLFRTSPASVWHDHPKRDELQTLYERLSALPPPLRAGDRRLISFGELLLSWYFDQLAEGKTAKACADIVRLFAGFRPAEARAIAAETLSLELSRPLGTRMFGRFTLPTGIRYIKESRSYLHRLSQQKVQVTVVSGSSRWSVEAVVEPLGVRPEQVAGIDLAEERGILTPHIKGPVPVLEGKVEVLARRYPRRPHLVFSDSAYDLPLFAYSEGLRVLVNSHTGAGHASAGLDNARDHSWVVIEHPTFEEGA